MTPQALTSPDFPAPRGTGHDRTVLGKKTFYAWKGDPDNRCEHVHVTRHAAMICARSM